MSCVGIEAVGSGVVEMRRDKTEVGSCALGASLQVQTETIWRKFGVSVEKLQRACGMDALVLLFTGYPQILMFLGR